MSLLRKACMPELIAWIIINNLRNVSTHYAIFDYRATITAGFTILIINSYMEKSFNFYPILLCGLGIINLISCSKSDTPPSGNSSDKCTGKNITLTATPGAANACTSTGSITVTASGSTNFTYKLNTNG